MVGEERLRAGTGDIQVRPEFIRVPVGISPLGDVKTMTIDGLRRPMLDSDMVYDQRIVMKGQETKSP